MTVYDRRMSNARTFEYVVFYGQAAWVAATLGPYVVSQGGTRDEAVLSLRDALVSYRAFEAGEGREPWSSLREDEMKSPARFHELAADALHDNPMDLRDEPEFAYRGEFTVDDDAVKERVTAWRERLRKVAS